MGSKSSSLRSRQLGMDEDIAAMRLNRIVLLKLVQLTGLDSCYRCGGKITRYQDLSLEHKIPWFNADPALFWDWGNLAFSHGKCNKAAGTLSRYPNSQTKLASNRPQNTPPGMAWCSGHQKYLPVTEFWKNRSNKNGLRHYCKICNR